MLSVPQEEDVNVMTSYLGQLVEDRNLEMVDLVLKCLHRLEYKYKYKNFAPSAGTRIQF